MGENFLIRSQKRLMCQNVQFLLCFHLDQDHLMLLGRPKENKCLKLLFNEIISIGLTVNREFVMLLKILFYKEIYAYSNSLAAFDARLANILHKILLTYYNILLDNMYLAFSNTDLHTIRYIFEY